MPTSPLILTRDQVRRVDRIAIERFNVPGIVLMENASRGVVDAIRRSELPREAVIVLCGGGNNGGDGLAIARHLANAGSDVTVGLCTDPARYTGDALVNWRIVRAMGLNTVQATPEWLEVSLRVASSSPPPTLLIDAVFGTGLTAPPREPFPRLVEVLNRSGKDVVAVDLPSGLDCDTGQPLGPAAVRASLTVTFVGLKKGFAAPGAERFTGRVEVADIGCPRAAIDLAMATDESAS
ncbi:MAG TPA: NAD(P)H-hydrate epimerase [Humisphaera sp.]